jgi:hypothetical protein
LEKRSLVVIVKLAMQADKALAGDAVEELVVAALAQRLVE